MSKALGKASYWVKKEYIFSGSREWQWKASLKIII